MASLLLLPDDERVRREELLSRGSRESVKGGRGESCEERERFQRVGPCGHGQAIWRPLICDGRILT